MASSTECREPLPGGEQRGSHPAGATHGGFSGILSKAIAAGLTSGNWSVETLLRVAAWESSYLNESLIDQNNTALVRQLISSLSTLENTSQDLVADWLLANERALGNKAVQKLFVCNPSL